MIQDVKKLGTHKIGTYMYAISKCASCSALFGNSVIKRGITWMWKRVWPQEGLNGVAYDNSLRALLGSNFETFAKM